MAWQPEVYHPPNSSASVDRPVALISEARGRALFLFLTRTSPRVLADSLTN